MKDFANILVDGNITEIFGKEKSGKTMVSIFTAFQAMQLGYKVLYFSSQTGEKVIESILEDYSEKTRQHIELKKFIRISGNIEKYQLFNNSSLKHEIENLVNELGNVNKMLIIYDDFLTFSKTNRNDDSANIALSNLKNLRYITSLVGKEVTFLITNQARTNGKIRTSGKKLGVNFRFSLSTTKVKSNPSMVNIKLIKSDYTQYELFSKLMRYEYRFQDSSILIYYKENSSFSKKEEIKGLKYDGKRTIKNQFKKIIEKFGYYPESLDFKTCLKVFNERSLRRYIKDSKIFKDSNFLSFLNINGLLKKFDGLIIIDTDSPLYNDFKKYIKGIEEEVKNEKEI